MQGAWHQKRVKQTVLCGIELNTYLESPSAMCGGAFVVCIVLYEKRGIGQKRQPQRAV